MAKDRVIYNDDFETQIWGRWARTAQELHDIVCEVRGTAVTTYAVKVCEYDNKNFYVGNKKGIDWSQIDFLSFGEKWRDYQEAANILRAMHDAGQPAFKTYIDACRDMGIRCTATFRMNDWHGPEPLDMKGSADISFWVKQHPQFAVREPATGRIMRLADFRHQQVRDYRLEVLKEILTDFDFDGVELDFMRSCWYFSPDYVRSSFGFILPQRFDELAPCLTDFICKVRDFLDDLGKQRGREMTLGCRVPDRPETARGIGFDVPAWIRAARLTYICPSGYQGMSIQLPAERWKAMCAGTDCGVYPMICPGFCTERFGQGFYETPFYAAAAQNHYYGGADGASIFNHFCPPLKHYGSIPMNAESISVIGSPQEAQKAPQHYYFNHELDVPVPTEAAISMTGSDGPRLSIEGLRATYRFRFGLDLAATGKQLTCMRFKLFDLTPEDEVDIDLNGTALPCAMSWRHRKVKGTGIPGPRYIQVGQVERYVGEPICDDLREAALAAIEVPLFQRPEARQEEGMHIFMLAEADTGAAASALQCGENILGVTLKRRRPGATVEGSVNEVELITSGE